MSNKVKWRKDKPKKSRAHDTLLIGDHNDKSLSG
jgi:hypothetical protein